MQQRKLNLEANLQSKLSFHHALLSIAEIEALSILRPRPLQHAKM